MANLTLVQAINLALTQEMEADDRVLILGEDVGLNGGVFRVTEGLQQRFGEHRVVDTPLAESGIIGTAIGLAVGGRSALRLSRDLQFSISYRQELKFRADELEAIANAPVPCITTRTLSHFPT